MKRSFAFSLSLALSLTFSLNSGSALAGKLTPATLAPLRPAAVVALPANHHPAVALAIQFASGAIDDPPGKAGLTYLTARVMAEGGTRALDAKQLIDALYPMAASIDARVDKEHTTFQTLVDRDHLNQMVRILTDVVAHPRFDPKELARLKTQAIDDVQKGLRQDDDEDLGKEALYELMYRGHPYGRLTYGHVSDLASITLADVEAQAARIFTLDRMTLGVAGGYPRSVIRQLKEALMGLPKTGPARAALPAPATHGPHFLLVDKQTDATAISIGMPFGLSRRSPDFVAMTVARSAFGEHRQFNGRLMKRLREARGLNYGDYAYIEHFEQAGGDAATAQTGRIRRQQDFTIWLRPVQNDNRLFALRAALYELQRTLTVEPFSPAEVAATKSFLDGYIRLFAQTDARKLGYALDDRADGTPNFLANWRKSLHGVTPAAVNAAWRKWIDPAQLRVVLVTPNASAVKQEILVDALSPMSYQKDAAGKVPQKPAALLAEDATIEKLPFGARGSADVKIIPVKELFQ